MRRLPVRVHAARGFSLLEILMVLVLLAVLLGAAFSAIHTATQAMAAGEKVIDRTNRLRVTQEFIRHEMSRTLPLAFGQDKTNGNNFVFQGEKDFVRFVAPMPGHLSRGGPYVQSLELARGRDGLQLVFTHQMLNGFDLDKLSANDVKPVLLIDHIRSGRFRFRTFDEKGELGDWTDDWKDPSITPLMVRIDLELDPATQQAWPIMDIPLMLDAGAVRNTGFIARQPQQVTQ